MERDEDDPPSRRPLPQVLHQEEGVKDVHAPGGLVQDHDVRVQEEVAGHVEPLPLRHGQVLHPGVLDLRQAQVFDEGVDLQGKKNNIKVPFKYSPGVQRTGGDGYCSFPFS